MKFDIAFKVRTNFSPLRIIRLAAALSVQTYLIAKSSDFTLRKWLALEKSCNLIVETSNEIHIESLSSSWFGYHLVIC